MLYAIFIKNLNFKLIQMKKNYILLFLTIILLSSCEGSDSYQGKWKAMNSKGEKFEIAFTPKTLSIKDSLGKSQEYNYTQKSIKSENSIESYGILLEDGRGYLIYFPLKDESIGLIKDENGEQMFTISRKKFITYEEIYKLN